MAIEIKELKVIIRVNNKPVDEQYIRKLVKEELNVYSNNLKQELESQFNKRIAKTKIR